MISAEHMLLCCAEGFLSYNHFNVNIKIWKTVRMENNLVNLVNKKLGIDLQTGYKNSITSKEVIELPNQKIRDGIFMGTWKIDAEKHSLSW